MTFLALVSIVAAVLQVILFFKVWAMCNNVKEIKGNFLEDKVTMDQLIYLSSVRDPKFSQTLQTAIYKSLYSVYKNYDDFVRDNAYETVYKRWEVRCNYYKWEFPEVFADAKSFNDFKKFLFEYSDGSVQ